MRRYLILLLPLTLASGCEAIQSRPPPTPETAAALLRRACARPDIWANIVTPDQQRALQIVCAAVGQRVGPPSAGEVLVQ